MEQDFATLMTRITEELVGPEDPQTVVSRYYTDDFEMLNDGHRLDRSAVAAHARPLRKNLVAYRFELHDEIREDGRLAARYTLRAELRNGRTVVTQVYMFGTTAADGRLRRIDQATRDLSETVDADGSAM